MSTSSASHVNTAIQVSAAKTYQKKKQNPKNQEENAKVKNSIVEVVNVWNVFADCFLAG